jgi:IS30 family transposase
MSRLGYDDILCIYKWISMNFTASQIAMKMHVSASTVYRLIQNNVEIKLRTKEYANLRTKACQHLHECLKTRKDCPDICERFQKYLCPKLSAFPFICDFCEARGYCTKERHLWNPLDVYSKRIQRLKETRRHLSLSTKKVSAFDAWITPMIKKHLSIEVLYSRFPLYFPVSPSTVRRWINQEHLGARRIDLLRAVSFKVKKQYGIRRPSSQNPLAKFEHTYQYFLDYVQVHPRSSIIEMDTVYGLMSEERKLLTFYQRQSHLQFAVLIPNLYPASVSRVLVDLQRRLGIHFSTLFDVILADNGPEFDELIPTAVHSVTGEILSHVFYTRPYRCGDKGGCERNHELFRYLVPKKHGFSDFMQEDINFMFSMINSYPRESLNWKTPIDVFKQLFPKEILDQLHIQPVPLAEINLKHYSHPNSRTQK